MNVEEMVALIEQRLPPEGGFEMVQFSDYELRALIASWRERGEALEKIRDGQPHTDTWETSIARAALKDKP